MSKELSIHSYQDCWSIMYMHIGRSLLDELGIEGEAIVRESVRRYGRDRGRTLREIHRKYNLKPNLYNLFNYYDLPLNTAYRQNKVVSTTQERITHTRACPIADLWKENNELPLGRMYCEEFHHAMFCAYAPKTEVNLAQTLTIEGRDYCSFATYLRPANMSPEERKEAFEEYDPSYKRDENFVFDLGSEKDRFVLLWAKLYFYFAQTAIEKAGEKGKQAIINGLGKTAMSTAEYLKKKAEKMDWKCDKKLVEEHLPLSLDMNEDKIWEEYDDSTIKNLLQVHFYNKLMEELGI